MNVITLIELVLPLSEIIGYFVQWSLFKLSVINVTLWWQCNSARDTNTAISGGL
jgi:hypothetical protein